MTDQLCTESCWKPAPCPTCARPMYPRGRDVPLGCYEAECCREARYSAANQRHLWSEHDSTRGYSDPEGWAEHVTGCEECRDD